MIFRRRSWLIFYLTMAMSASKSCDAQIFDFVYEDFVISGEEDTMLHGVNIHGQVVGETGEIDVSIDQDGEAIVTSQTKGFIYDGEAITYVEYPGAISTSLSAINDRGHAVGRFVDETGLAHGFSFVEGQYTEISFPGALATMVLGINNQGDLVGSYSDDNFQSDSRGYSLINGIYTSIDLGISTSANAINNHQEITGTFTQAGLPFDATRGFLLQGDNNIEIIHPKANTLAEITRAGAISDTGIIGGNYIFFDLVNLTAFEKGYIRDPSGQFADIILPGPLCQTCFKSIEGVTNDDETIVGYYSSAPLDSGGDYVGYIGRIRQFGDLNADGRLDAEDIDFLATAIRENSGNPLFDLDASGTLDASDFDYMIASVIGTLPGDGNLDGYVDGSDFNLWNDHRASPSTTGWMSGDYDGSGNTDEADLSIWSANRFSGVPSPTVPEPGLSLGIIFAIAFVVFRANCWQKPSSTSLESDLA